MSTGTPKRDHRIKIFKAGDPVRLEAMVNEWLASRPSWWSKKIEEICLYKPSRRDLDWVILVHYTAWDKDI